MVFADKIVVLSLMCLVVPLMNNTASLFKRLKIQVRMAVLLLQNCKPTLASLFKKISQTIVPLSVQTLAPVSFHFAPIKSKISDTSILNGSQILITPRSNVVVARLVGTKMMVFYLVVNTQCHLP